MEVCLAAKEGNNLEEALKALGLNSKEIAVYLAILKLGQANVLEIARQAHIPRPTVYGHLEKLLAENLISSIIKGKRRYYLAEDPAKIDQILAEKQTKIKQALPSLRNIYEQATHRPVIRSYEGVSGIKQMLADVLISTLKGGSYDVILNSRDEFALLGEDFNRHVARRIAKGIKIRTICERSELTKGWDKNTRKFLRSVRFVPRGQHFSVSTHIYGNKVSMFSLKGPISGVIIENKEIADLQRLEFEYMWKALQAKNLKRKTKNKNKNEK